MCYFPGLNLNGQVIVILVTLMSMLSLDLFRYLILMLQPQVTGVCAISNPPNMCGCYFV